MPDFFPEHRVLIFAGGAHAAVVIEAIRAIQDSDKPIVIVGLVDAFVKPGEEVLGVPVIGDEVEFERRRKNEVGPEALRITHFAVGIGSVKGGTDLRAKVYSEASSFFLKPFPVRHPSAIISPSAEIGRAAVILAGAVVGTRSKIGTNVIVNTRASVDHDCEIGDHSHIAPGATLSGNVKVGANSLVGVGAVVMQGVTIGDNVTIGAGAVVVRDCLEPGTYVGCPARSSRPLSAPARARRMRKGR